MVHAGDATSRVVVACGGKVYLSGFARSRARALYNRDVGRLHVAEHGRFAAGE